MPLTSFQSEILFLLAANRNPESHLAGGAVINRGENSPRFSADLDLFHDVVDLVATCADADTQTLAGKGFAIHWELRQPGMHRAWVSRGGDRLKLEWCYDSAYRFFPTQADVQFGYCLHPADLATNKVLALAGRSEIRDFLDILYLHETYLSLGAIIWAACGKDQGFSPESLLNMANRHVRFREVDLASENLARPISLLHMKELWLEAASQAEALFSRLPVQEVGCLYLDRNRAPVTPCPGDSAFDELVRHYGALRGAWPQVS